MNDEFTNGVEVITAIRDAVLTKQGYDIVKAAIKQVCSDHDVPYAGIGKFLLKSIMSGNKRKQLVSDVDAKDKLEDLREAMIGKFNVFKSLLVTIECAVEESGFKVPHGFVSAISTEVFGSPNDIEHFIHMAEVSVAEAKAPCASSPVVDAKMVEGNLVIICVNTAEDEHSSGRHEAYVYTAEDVEVLKTALDTEHEMDHTESHLHGAGDLQERKGVGHAI